MFQAGAFVRHNIGAAYVTAALAYAWQDITTDRTVTVAGFDQLRARFDANAWSGRLESGYRFVVPVMGGFGVTPYAAGQFTTFFENCPVLRAESPELKDSRLLLVDLVSRVIKQALDLLGIRVVERM